jgi:mono/diheme cytochrome c family protein
MKALSILLLLLTAAACTGEPEITVLGERFDDQQIAEGQRIYMQYCAACHGPEGEGQFPDAPLQPDETGRIGAPPHDSTGHTWHHGDELLLRYTREGGIGDPARFYPMPAFGDQLSDEEIMLVIAYIKTLWTEEHRTHQAQVTEAERQR